jgi:hypothetical protein
MRFLQTVLFIAFGFIQPVLFWGSQPAPEGALRSALEAWAESGSGSQHQHAAYFRGNSDTWPNAMILFADSGTEREETEDDSSSDDNSLSTVPATGSLFLSRVHVSVSHFASLPRAFASFPLFILYQVFRL